MSDENELKRTPAKAEDLDFKALAEDLTKAPELVTTRPPDVELPEPQKVKSESAGEKATLAATSQPASGTEAPGAPAAPKRGPADPVERLLVKATVTLPGPLFATVENAPTHDGQLRAAGDRLIDKIVYRLGQRIDQLLARLEVLSEADQIKLAPQLMEMLVATKDMQMTNHWTKKLEKVILERMTLLQNAKSNGLRKLGGYAGQVAKELHTDGRTTAARNKKAPGRIAPDDLPAAEM